MWRICTLTPASHIPVILHCVKLLVCVRAQPLTVAELKEQLRSHGLRVSGKREDLVQRLLAHTEVTLLSNFLFDT
jgi:SAP domain